MSERIYVYKDTDDKIEELSKLFNIAKAQVVEIAVNDYYRRLKQPKKGIKP